MQVNHHSSEHRKPFNPQLKQMVEESDFKEAPLLFGEIFGSIAKQRIEAAAALKKNLASDKGKWGFCSNHPGAVGVAALPTAAKGEVGSLGGKKLPRGCNNQRND